MPASSETIAAFVDAMATDRAPATVRRYVASVAATHRGIGLEQTARSEPVRRALQRMHRKNGRRQTQARGVTWSLRQRLLDAAGDGLIDARNRALLAVAYDTLVRRSELVALQVSDIIEEYDGSATVLVRRSKADPEGRGATLYLAPDGVSLVKEWLKRSGVRERKSLALSVPRSGGRPARRESGPAHLQGDGRARGVTRVKWSRGFPGTAPGSGRRKIWSPSGIEMPAILQSGRWKTTAMVNRYAEHLVARRSGAAQLARLQHRG